MPGTTTLPREEIALERGLLTGIAALRWAAWLWMAVVILIDARSPETFAHLPVALAFNAAALAFTIWATIAGRAGPTRLLAYRALLIEGLIAVSMALADNFVYSAQHYPHAQSLGSIWPFAWVMTVAVRFAGRGGALAGLTVGVANGLSEVIFVRDIGWYGNRVFGVIGTAVLYTLGGAVAGFVAIKLREAERQIAVSRAREEVARTLHDGVLQTLAIVQRRSDDAELIDLARDQEYELREFLFGALPGSTRPRGAGPDIPAALRQVAAKVERQHGTRASVVTTGDLPTVTPDAAVAIAGAVAESLTNAAKHGDARQAIVFLEPGEAGGIFCSVKDDGRGFEPIGAREGVGITRSIRGRITDVGGRVEIDGRPGRGTEVRLWVP
jgi:signal transduction histidine kinase